MSPEKYDEQTEAAEELAAGVQSFLSSLPYMAPEMVAFQANVKLAQPLKEYQQARVNEAHDALGDES